MPIRVKSRPQQAEAALRTPSPTGRHARFGAELPDISDSDSFRVVVKKLSVCVSQRRGRFSEQYTNSAKIYCRCHSAAKHL